jgi:hypothetical protein
LQRELADAHRRLESREAQITNLCVLLDKPGGQGIAEENIERRIRALLEAATLCPNCGYAMRPAHPHIQARFTSTVTMVCPNCRTVKCGDAGSDAARDRLGIADGRVLLIRHDGHDGVLSHRVDDGRA